MIKKVLKLTLALILISLIAPQKAHAYLDPGSGSFLVQIIVASIARGWILS